jgi:1,4-dihydroxy-2-naphthoyl-CoA hydrolase
MDPLEKLNQETLPFAQLLGIRLLSAAPDRVVAEMLVRDDLCTRPAVLHGGAMMAFADTLGACATAINCVTARAPPRLKTNFLAPVPVGTKVTGECLPLHRGKRTMVWQTRITSQEGRLLGVVTQTQMVL